MMRAPSTPLFFAIAIAASTACEEPPPKPPPADSTTDGGVNPPVPTPAAPCSIAAEPSSFGVPIIPGLVTGSFHEVDGRATCANGKELQYELRDMNGDRQPDLVVRTACDDTTIGPLAWRVHFNEGTGFAANPVRFDLPLPRPPECAKVELLDVDGDLRPDFVTTSTCLDASVGTAKWIVQRNNGAGWDASSDFTLPTAPLTGAFKALESASLEATCPGNPAYRTFDIDGDLKLDLVIVSACDDGFLSTTTWRVHRGTGTGFEETPISFGLPTAPPPFKRLYADPRATTADCAASALARSYEVADFDGDFAPDLLVTKVCNDTTVGSTRWLLYKNEKTRFAPEPRALDLPLLPGALGRHGAFQTTSAPAACDQHRPAFALVDFTGDFKKDLLFTHACNDPQAGITRWLLYPQGADGSIAGAGLAVSLPAVLGGTAGEPLGFTATPACERAATKRPGFFSAHLVNNQFGLVVTSSCLDTSVGHTRWFLHGASCTATP